MLVGSMRCMWQQSVAFVKLVCILLFYSIFTTYLNYLFLNRSSFCFTLCSVDLLRHTAEFIDKLMEVEEDICSQWSNPELVVAIMEAIKQTGYETIDCIVNWCQVRESTILLIIICFGLKKCAMVVDFFNL